MIVGFCEIQRVRKYDQMSVTDEDEMERGSGTDFYFMKVKFIFIAFGMLYSAILVVSRTKVEIKGVELTKMIKIDQNGSKVS
jgi:hypothetical protein